MGLRAIVVALLVAWGSVGAAAANETELRPGSTEMLELMRQGRRQPFEAQPGTWLGPRREALVLLVDAERVERLVESSRDQPVGEWLPELVAAVGDRMPMVLATNDEPLLERLDPTEAASVLADVLADGEPSHREAALLLLAELGSEAAAVGVPAVLAFHEEDGASSQEELVNRALLGLLHREVTWVSDELRLEAARVVSEFHWTSEKSRHVRGRAAALARPLLPQLLEGADEATALEVLRAAQHGSTEVPELEQLMFETFARSSAVELRLFALRALQANWGDTRLLRNLWPWNRWRPLASEHVWRQEPKIRKERVRVHWLRETGLPMLIAALEDDSPRIREAIQDLLVGMPGQLVPHLVSSLRPVRADESLRMEVLELMAKREDGQAMLLLAQVADSDPSQRVRRWIFERMSLKQEAFDCSREEGREQVALRYFELLIHGDRELQALARTNLTDLLPADDCGRTACMSHHGWNRLSWMDSLLELGWQELLTGDDLVIRALLATGHGGALNGLFHEDVRVRSGVLEALRGVDCVQRHALEALLLVTQSDSEPEIQRRALSVLGDSVAKLAQVRRSIPGSELERLVSGLEAVSRYADEELAADATALLAALRSQENERLAERRRSRSRKR
ncbi:MAG: hypothetical protein AAF533_09380 [Acidobacteriota bacterium]